MPELPEVETVKRGLEKHLLGKTIKTVEVKREKNFKGNPNRIIGKKIRGFDRRGKYLFIKLDNGNLYLVVHLKMTGQLLIESQLVREDTDSAYDAVVLPNKYTRVVIEFADGEKLYFNCLRAFGWVKVVEKKDSEELGEALGKEFGPEPFSQQFSAEYLNNKLTQTRRAIKTAIMDQSYLAGVGNIYASEALFCAGIDPRRPAKKVVEEDPDKIEKLYLCIKKVLKKGIKYSGSTGADGAFRDYRGEKGEMQKHLKVYDQEGERCPECEGKIKKIKVGGRGTYFCPQCQN
jgi:formamidopyrimidine-DNA glycosylase